MDYSESPESKDFEKFMEESRKHREEVERKSLETRKFLEEARDYRKSQENIRFSDLGSRLRKARESRESREVEKLRESMANLNVLKQSPLVMPSLLPIPKPPALRNINNPDLSIADQIDLLYRKLSDKGKISMDEETFELVTKQPKACALRILSEYDLDEYGPLHRKIAIIAAAALAYSAHYLEEEFGIYPDNRTLLDLWDIPHEYIPQFKRVQLQMFKEEGYDVCRKEITY